MTKTDLLLKQASYKKRENNNKNLVLFNNSLFFCSKLPILLSSFVLRCYNSIFR